jgi:hypothetical protein
LPAVSNRDLISAIRAGRETRERVFDLWVQRHAGHFAKGEEGYKFYCATLEVVRAFCSTEGVRAYEERFLPLVDREFLQERFIELFGEEFEQSLPWQSRPWGRRLWRHARR